MKQTLGATLLSLFVILCTSQQLYGGPKHLFKIASLAPAGSVWVEQFENFGKEVSENTGGEVGFRVYPGGVMGDDQAMFRKMRVGQLHGGGFTMSGISRFVPDFRAMAFPFLFNSYEEIDYVKKGLLPEFKKKFREKGMEFIAMTEVGFIYAMSTKPINSYDALRASKNWSPSGDPISEVYMGTLGITPVALTIPDVLSSLQSGLIETVYNSLYGSLVLQWFTKTKNIVDTPYGYAYGVFAISSKKYAKLSKSHQEIIRKAADNHFPVLLEKTRQSNAESRQVLQQHGITFLSLDDATLNTLKEKRDVAIKNLVPGSVSQEIRDKTFSLLSEFRKQ